MINKFLNTFKENSPNKISLYCTGFPELPFLDTYSQAYPFPQQIKNDQHLIFFENNYSYIRYMGFDAISLWDLRRGPGGFPLKKELGMRIDPWGRKFKDNWYVGDGIIKDRHTLGNWEELRLPLEKNLQKLGVFIRNLRKDQYNLTPLLSLPGLFEKSWQAMGLKTFAINLRKDIEFIVEVITFFEDYILKLVKVLQKVGVKYFLIADDIGYKKHLFIPKDLWSDLYVSKYKNIVHRIREGTKESLCVLHSDGYISEMIDVFIECGFDGVQSLEPNSGVLLKDLFKKFGDNIVFIGNVDVSTLLTFGTQIDVKNYVENLIKASKRYNARLIISPTQQIHGLVKPKNLKTMIDSTNSYQSD